MYLCHHLLKRVFDEIKGWRMNGVETSNQLLKLNNGPSKTLPAAQGSAAPLEKWRGSYSTGPRAFHLLTSVCLFILSSGVTPFFIQMLSRQPIIFPRWNSSLFPLSLLYLPLFGPDNPHTRSPPPPPSNNPSCFPTLHASAVTGIIDSQSPEWHSLLLAVFLELNFTLSPGLGLFLFPCLHF